MAEGGMKAKKCRICKRTFKPISSMAKVCSVPCSLELVRQDRARKEARAQREERKSLRERMERAKTRGQHLRELQAAFNQWIRMRDAKLPCISCGRPATWKGQWDAGHYRSRGSSPALRFDPANVHKQCGPCNVHLSGNLVEYRRGLVRKIGFMEVKRLEGPQSPLKLTIPEIQELKAKFRAEVRRLKKEAE